MDFFVLDDSKLWILMRGSASRLDPGKDCRNFLTGLVVIPGLEVQALVCPRLCPARGDGVRAKPVGTPSRASYCFPALSFGHPAECRAANGQEANDAWLSQTADSPCPDSAATLEAGRGGRLKMSGVQGMSPLPAGGASFVRRVAKRIERWRRRVKIHGWARALLFAFQ
jgi:hypothetical protein